MLAFSEISGATLESVHLNSLISLLTTQKNGASVSLPDKKQASVVDGMLIFKDEERIREKKTAEYRVPLKAGFNIIENTPFAVEISTMSTAHPEVYEGYTTDGGHFTPLGYSIVTAEITPVLKELLGR